MHQITAPSTTKTRTFIAITVVTAVLCLVAGAIGAPIHTLAATTTTVSIVGTNFQINGVNTAPNGLLLDSRMIQGVFDDENATTKASWVYPDTHVWDPQRNTNEFVAAMPSYAAHGVRMLTVGLQGGGPKPGQFGGNQPNITTAFNADGSLKPAWMTRLDQVLKAADAAGIVINVQLFYFGQINRVTNPTGITTGINNVVDFLVNGGYTNAILEIANEDDNGAYSGTVISSGNVQTAIAQAQTRSAGKLKVSVSFNGGSIPPDAVISQADFILLHGNGQGPSGISGMVSTVKSRSSYTAKPKPIVFNEDSTSISNMDAAVNAGAGWGYYDQGSNNYVDGFQSPPVNWTINTSSKTAFFNHALVLSGTTPPPAPTVTMLAPTTGPAAGGTSVTITGTNFTGATSVKFGATATTAFTISSATQITATTPSGTSATNAVDKFTYTGPPPPAPTVSAVAPSNGPAGGGTPVTITGTHLTGATAVNFGTTAAATFTVNSATQITAKSPAGTGTVDVTVTTAGGTSAIVAADKFTFTPSPTVSALAPNNGPTAGGTPVTITGANFTGATAVKFGTTAATTFTVNSATQIAATSPPGTGTVDVTVTGLGGTSATSAADRFTYTLPPAAYTAVTPVRLLDTRNGGGPLGPAASRNLTVAGVTPGAPSGASAVVLNVTVTNTTAASYLTVYPMGSTQPLASNLNWVTGETIPNLVSVQVGSGGAITIFNAVGSTDVVVDLEGYFAAPSGTAGGEVALTPARITDTRAASGFPNAGGTLAAGANITVQVTGAGGVPMSGVSAAILNVTVTNTSAASFLTIWPTTASRPTASNLNWTAGVTIPNRVIVPVSSLGRVSIYNAAGSADVVVDISGYFTDSTASGKFFTSVSPQRIADTRSALGCPATLPAAGTCTLSLTGIPGLPSTASAVILNVTVTNTTAPSFLTAYPSTASLPNASDLNWKAGQTIPNLVVATLGSSGAIGFYNAVGSVDVVVDIAGWFS